MKELTAFISFLSDSLSYISNYSYENWLTVFSDATYFTMAADRYYRDALIANYTDIDLWAQSIPDPATQYHTQDIPATCADAYYRAAEVARQDGSIRHRMPFHRPLFGGLESGSHVTPAQAVVRQRFKNAIDRFIPLGDTDRADIYARALGPGLWYYNFFLSEEFALIKRVFSQQIIFDHTDNTDIYFTEPWNIERTLVFFPYHAYNSDPSDNTKYRLRYYWGLSLTSIQVIVNPPLTDFKLYMQLQLIEFY